MAVGIADTPDLTGPQIRVLRFILEVIARDGYPPTRPEISRALRLRTEHGCTVHLHALARKGYLTIKPKTARGIRVLRKPDGTLV